MTYMLLAALYIEFNISLRVPLEIKFVLYSNNK